MSPSAPCRLLAAPLLAAVVLLPAACGWHLRGSYAMPPTLVPIAVEGEGIAGELRDSLRRTGALDGGEPASRVEILEQNQDRRVVSVDADGKVNEYEIRYDVRWQLTASGDDGTGQRVLIAPQTLQASRTYDFDSGSVLSKSDEEETRIEEMRDDIAQQILFRLQGWKAPPASEDTGTTTE